MQILVQKYGGTSVGDAEKIRKVAKRIIKKKEEGYSMVVVVSAMGKSTDRLVELAHELNPHPAKRELDMLLATGEQVSISVLSMALQNYGADAISFTGSQIGVRTVGMHGRSRILDIDTKRILEALHEGKIVIVAGFQGINEQDDITTLGRGGSDTSAVALSAALHCPCEIYTDVDGIYGIDPRRYPPARKLSRVSCDEMLEMASLGAGVMHARAIELGSKYGIEIRVGSSSEDIPGTAIMTDTNEAPRPITGLAVDDSEFFITLDDVKYTPHTAATLFLRIARAGINIDMIAQTPESNGTIDISFSAPLEDRAELEKILDGFQQDFPCSQIQYDDSAVKLSAVGSGMAHTPGVAVRFFDALQTAGIPIIMITSSDIRISCVIPAERLEDAIGVVAGSFDL